MNLYFAPLEGISGYLYRSTLQEFFGGIDAYFIPFIQPKQHGQFTTREKKDTLPENNVDMHAIPQLLTKNAQDFLLAADKLEALGYTELNLNLGCPMRTVVSKGKGSGMLADPENLDRFLAEIYQKSRLPISIKTRIGLANAEEFTTLLSVFRQYPVSELIVHPRVQQDYYANQPDWEAFSAALAASPFPVCYNGDIVRKSDYENLMTAFPGLDRVMIGRGLLRNPGLARELKGGAPMKKAELKAFHDSLYQKYQRELSGDRNILFKMKELWAYMITMFDGGDAYSKKIKKAERLDNYDIIIESLFERQELIKETGETE